MKTSTETNKERKTLPAQALGLAVIVLGIVGLSLQLKDSPEPTPPSAAVVPPVVSSAVAPSATMRREPVEFQLDVGDDRYDLAGAPIVIDGIPLAFAWAAERRHVVDGFSLTLPRAATVLTEDGSSMVAWGEISLQLHTLDASVEEAMALRTLSRPYPVESRPVSRAIGGEASGRAFEVGGTRVEVFAPKLDSQVRLGVVVQRPLGPKSAALADELLGGIAAGVLPPLSPVHLTVAKQRHALHLNEPLEVTIGDQLRTVVLRKRPKVRRPLGPLGLEHGPDVVATTLPTPLGSVLNLTSPHGAILVMHSAEALRETEVRQALKNHGAFAAGEPVTRVIGERAFEGKRGILAVGIGELTYELFVYPSGGGSLAVMINYAAEDRSAISAIVEPIWASIAPWGAASGPAKPVAKPKPSALPAEVRAKIAACEGGKATACFEAGEWLVSEDDGRIPDYERAETLFGRACDAGSAMGCLGAGFTVDGTGGRVADMPKARRYLLAACKLRSSVCPELVGVLRKAEGGHAEAKEALIILDQTCKTGELVACHDLAWLHEAGRGTKKDVRLALKRYEKACRDGHADSCHRAGELHQAGAGSDPNPEQARRYFRRACRAGLEADCTDAERHDDDDDDDDLSADDF